MLLTDQLCSFDLPDGWRLDVFSEFKPLCLEGEQLSAELSSWVEKIKHGEQRAWADFRQQIRLKSSPVMMGVFYSQKRIRLSSARLSNELFLLHLIESEEHRPDENIDQTYKALKEHVESLARLDPRDFPSVYEWGTCQYGLIDLLDEKAPVYRNEVRLRQQGLIDQIMVHLNAYKPVLFERLSDVGLGLTAQYALLRIHLLKFLAILPSLDHDTTGVDVKRILLESLRRLLSDSKKAKLLKKKGQERALSKELVMGMKVTFVLAKLVPAKFLAHAIRTSVRFMARRFIAGESIDEAQKAFQGLFTTGRDVTLDQLGELVVSEKEADHYRDEVLRLVRGFRQHVQPGEKNRAGINRAHVSIKVSALCSDFKPEAPQRTYESVAPRLKEILLAAKEEQVFLNIDAEHYHYRDIVLNIYSRVLLETPELKDFAGTGIVLQAYLRDAPEHLQDILTLAKKRGHLMPVRLVKGAYWDAETVEADAHSYNAPQFLNKEETDLMFRQMIYRFFEQGEYVQLCLASHNFADHCFAEAVREELFPKAPVIEHQCLHMTYEALSCSLAKMGWVTRNYVPIGSLIVGMAYLVRRIMENSSQVGVLTIMRSHKKTASLQGPEEVHRDKLEKRMLARDITQERPTEKFFNVAPVRTYLEAERAHVEQALEQFKKTGLGQSYANKFSLSGDWDQVISSSAPEVVVGKIQKATPTDVDKALATVEAALSESWCEQSSDGRFERISALCKAAHLMTARRNELSALIMYEAGKTLNEALGDVDEAIDFLNFYAREEARLHHLSIKGRPRTRGPIAVISPWNFPLAIPCGMVAASLVAGNPVILKSAEQTPLIAQALIDLLHQAGVPTKILIHLPGPGEVVGQALVDSPKIAGIVFTGSKKVGMMIAAKAQARFYEHPLTGEHYPVRVITEMGGKNAIIVTSSAELDETVAGILYSAFGHAGQKCSAASRVIVHEAVAERLKERLAQAVGDLKVGQAFDFATDINPLISKEDQERVRTCARESAEQAQRSGGRVLIDRSLEEVEGFAVGPSVFEISYEEAKKKASWAQREIFGPVLHLIKVKNLNQAIEVFNSTEYALTGGVFSQSQDEIDWLVERMECGNLYVNRSITGARVSIEPFGGFKLSGTGPKAGGKAYVRALHLFHTVKEKRFDILEVEAGEEGSEYQFDLARPSGLKVQARAERLSEVLTHLHTQYEVYFQSVDGDHKEILERFATWVQKNLVSFQTKEHANRKIPGQISVNNYQLVQEHALLIAGLSRPTFPTVLQFFAALAMGVGVTVVARNQTAYTWWVQLLDLLVKSGFSRENVEVYFPSEQGLKRALENPLLSSVITDGDRAIHDKLTNLYSTEYTELRMRSLLTPYDAPSMTDFKALCEHYLWVRSLAVNTMRHGAPLELEVLS